MPRLHVCSLALIGETVTRTGARSLLTLLSPGTPVERPSAIEPGRHLYVSVSDIVAPMPGQVAPAAAHLQELLAFVRGWDRAEPMVIHCYAGVSRSTAAAFIVACALAPGARRIHHRQSHSLRFANRHPECAPRCAGRRRARPQGPNGRGDRGNWPWRGMF